MSEAGARRSVLVLAYFFPPIGGASASRNAALVRRFAELRYEPIVVTGSGRADDHWTPVDETASDEGRRILRVPPPEPLSARGVRRRAERLLDLLPDWYRWWIAGATELARTVVADVDVIYASLEPYESALVADRLSAESGVPWVADLLDPWALDEMRLHVTGIHRARDTRRMGRWLRSAAAVVMSTPEAERRLRSAFPALTGTVDAIPLGFDPGDFGGDPPARDGDVFRIVHTGFMHTEAALKHRRTRRLRRAVDGIYLDADFLPRSHVYLMRAIEAVLAEEPALEGRIELHLVGVPTAADERLAAGKPFVRFHGYVPHAESVAFMRSADLLFLPMHEPVAGRPAGLVPAKTYEYLASGRPILAAVPPGDARELLGRAGNAHVCAPTDVGAMTAALWAEIDRWRRGDPPQPPRPDVLAAYTIDHVAGRLVQHFDASIRRT